MELATERMHSYSTTMTHLVTYTKVEKRQQPASSFENDISAQGAQQRPLSANLNPMRSKNGTLDRRKGTTSGEQQARGKGSKLDRVPG